MAIVVSLTNVKKKGKKKIIHFWMNVPKELQQFYPKENGKFLTVHTQSLHTSDKLEAAPLADALTAKYKKEHRELRAAMNNEPSKVIPIPKKNTSNAFDLSSVEYKLNQLSDDLIGMEKDRLNALYYEIGNLRHLLRSTYESDLSVERLSKADMRPVLDQTLLGLCQKIAESEDLSDGVLRRKTARFIIPKLRDILQKVENQIPPLIGKFVGAVTESKFVEGQWVDVPVQTNIAPNAPTLAGAEIPLLSEALEKYIKVESPKKNTIKARRSGIKQFIDWVGDGEDKPISEYTADEVVEYRNNCLRKLPDRRKNREKYKGKTLRQAVEISTPEERVCATRINDSLSSIRVVFRFAMTRPEWGVKFNPASGLNEKKSRESATRKGRTSYNDDEIKKLFEILPYNEKKPSWYWSVLICLYNSFRISEICQLYTSDVIKKDGFWCFDINENDAEVTQKSIKTDSTCRIVPIHPKLIEIGFLGYVKQRKDTLGKKDDLIFPNVTYSESDDGYGRTTSRWFNERFKQKFILEKAEKKKDFHSLRHTFGRYARNKVKMDRIVEKILMGHAQDKNDEAHDIYTETEMPFIYDELIKLDYGLKIPENPFMKQKAAK